MDNSNEWIRADSPVSPSIQHLILDPDISEIMVNVGADLH